MNPLRNARNLREDYLRLLRTVFEPRQERLDEAFEREVKPEGFVSRDAGSLAERIEETRRRFRPIAGPCHSPRQTRSFFMKGERRSRVAGDTWFSSMRRSISSGKYA